MLTNLRIFLLGMILAGSVLSCTDHLPPVPAAPASGRFRLKTLEKVNLSTTMFNYDQGNRLLSYNSGTFQYFYDEQSRISRYDLAIPSNTIAYDSKRFTYYPNSNSFDIGFYTFNGFSENKYETRFFTVDGNKQITGFTNDGQSAYMAQSYQYTGGNITKAVFTVGRTQETRVYEFDSKPNPYYGSMVPGVDDFLTYSRNNVTKKGYRRIEGWNAVCYC